MKKIMIPLLSLMLLSGGNSLVVEAMQLETGLDLYGSAIEFTVPSNAGEDFIQQYLGGEKVVYENASNFSMTTFLDYYQDYGYGILDGHWALTPLQKLLDIGAISGVPYDEGNRFDANRSITGAELVSIIMRVADFEVISYPEMSWAESTMQMASDYELVPNSFVSTAGDPLTREKMAYILVNSARVITGETASNEMTGLTIPDLNDASSQYKESITSAYKLGLLVGDEDGSFRPKDSTTRAETSAIVCRLFELSPRVFASSLGSSAGTEDATQSTDPTAEGYVDPRPSSQQIPMKDGTSPSEDLSNVGWAGMVFPKEGDYIDGVYVNIHPETGVMGYGEGQVGGVFLGVIGPNGNEIQVGSSAPALNDTTYNDYDTALITGKYEQRGNYVYWRMEWNLIDGYVLGNLRENYANVAVGTGADILGNLISNADPNDANTLYYTVLSNGSTYWQSNY